MQEMHVPLTMECQLLIHPRRGFLCPWLTLLDVLGFP
jgi:hypothetical protein